MQIFDTIDSTQIEAKRQIDLKGKIVQDVIFTYEQTKGVSTKANFPWNTKRGDMNYTAIWNIEELQKQGSIFINHITFCVGCAIYDVLQSFDKKLNIQLKWPNDVLIISNKDNVARKISGVLSEIYKGHFLVGNGMNVLNFPIVTEHFAATSLLEETGKQIDCFEIFKLIFEKVENNISVLQKNGFEPIKDAWKRHAYCFGGTLLLRDNNEVIFEDIDNHGNIIARQPNNEKQIIISSDEIIVGNQR